MKNIRLTILLCAAALAGQSQPYGEKNYAHAGSICSSGINTSINTNGFAITGYRQTSSGSQPNFYIDKTGPGGVFSPASAIPFSNSYNVYGDPTCPAIPSQITNCNGISTIETNLSGTSTAWYALAGSYSDGIFFGTLDQSGVPIITVGFPFTSNNTTSLKPYIVESNTPYEYFVVGAYFDGSNYSMYIINVNSSGTVLGAMSYQNSLGFMVPHAVMMSPYANEIVIVGQAAYGTNSNRAFFSRIDATNLNTVQQFDLYGPSINSGSGYFSSIAVANSSNLGSSGYVVGGYTDVLLPSQGDVWMLKLDPSGIIVWDNVIEPTSDPLAKEVVGVMERYSSTYGYTYYGAVKSQVGMMVLKLDDNGKPFTATLPIDNVNEFIYDNSSPASAVPTAISYLDNGSTSDIGIHVYGTTTSTGNRHYFVEAAFNGYSGSGSCLDYQTSVAAYNPGPTNIMNTILNPVAGLGSCASFNITSTNLSTTPNTICNSTSLPTGGSNNKATGIATQQSAENGFAVYPNPVSNKLQVKFTAAENASAKIELYDYLGRFIHNIPVTNMGGPQTAELDLSGLNIESGIYIIKANINGQSSKQKIVYTKE